MEALREEHIVLLRDIERRYHDFSDLDSRFHQLINSAAPNQFIDGFYDIITLIFHYHYQWNKRDERLRNEVEIGEHITYIEALISRNAANVERACRAHLVSAKKPCCAPRHSNSLQHKGQLCGTHTPCSAP